VHILKTHAYLFANLPLLALISGIAIRARRENLGAAALFSGVACLPASVLALMHEGGYWRPIRLGGGPLGIEDLVFAFTVGAAAWLCAAGPYRKLAAPGHIVTGQAVTRLLLWGAASSAAAFGLWRAGVDCMSATLAPAFLLLAALLARRAQLWPLAITGPAVFVPLYVVVVRVQLAVWPDYLLQWSRGGPWSGMVFGMPAGEIAWAAAFAAVWPVAIASAAGMELNPAKLLPLALMEEPGR
jgi:hypothetical protein